MNCTMAENWKCVHFGLLLIAILSLSYTEVSSAGIPPEVKGIWWYSYGNKLSWNRSPRAQVDFYNISLNCTKSGIHQLNTTAEQIVISGIRRDQCCYGRVSAVNQYGEGPQSSRVAKIGPRIKGGGRYQISDYEVQYDYPNTTVTIKWTTKPYPSPGSIFKFVVKIVQQRGRHRPVQTLVCKGPKCIYPCDFKMSDSYKQFDQGTVYFHATFETEAASIYQVDIKSYTPEMRSGRLIGIRQFTTRNAKPSSPVLDVKAVHISQTSVNVSWLPPVKSNGYISSYKIKLDYKDQNCSSVPSSADYYLPVERAETLKSRKDNKYLITGLKPNTQYKLQVLGINSAGEGLKWSKPFTFTTASRRALTTVRSVKKTVGKTFVQLEWAPPCPLEEPISGYTIEVTHRGKVLSVVNTSEPSIKITDLLPDTFYTINISGNNSGMFSRIDALTKMDAFHLTVDQFGKISSQMEGLKKEMEALKSLIQSKELKMTESFKKVLDTIEASVINKTRGLN